MFRHILSTFFIYFITLNISNAQSSLAHEIGFIFGPSLMKSDYGERNDSSTNFGNNGFGIGLVHYLNFATNARYGTYFNEHFKVRTELSYSQTKLNHFGKWVEGNSNSIGKQQLRAMEGKSSIINLGAQLEYSPLNEFYDFENSIGSFSPYVSLGIQYNFYDVKTTSSLGELGIASTTFPKYLTPSDGHSYGFTTENGGVLSIVSGVGVRYKLSDLSDLMIETRFQYFNSDWIDGLNPNKEIYTENKYNDWQIWLNFGYVFYLR